MNLGTIIKGYDELNVYKKYVQVVSANCSFSWKTGRS